MRPARILATLVALWWPFAASAAGHGYPLQDAGTDVRNLASLQRGARNFVNYCLGCHSLKYMRYSQVAEDLALTEDQLRENLMFTGEGGPDRGIAPVGFGLGPVNDARRIGRRVFAFGRAAAFFGAEGLAFERTALAGPPIDRWITELPRGTVVAGAAAYAAVPLEMFAITRRDSTATPRPRPFTAFAFVAGKSGAARREGESATSLMVNAETLASSLPPMPGSLRAVADERGARIELAGRVIAAADMGLALGVLRPDGTFWRALEFQSGEILNVEHEGSLYELEGEMPCVEASTAEWTDVAPVLAKSPSVEHHVVAGAGHLIHESIASRDEFVQQVEAFLANA